MAAPLVRSPGETDLRRTPSERYFGLRCELRRSSLTETLIYINTTNLASVISVSWSQIRARAASIA